MACYRIKVPHGHRLAGRTSAGRRVHILPGEYLVHRFCLKAHRLRDNKMATLRFVGADSSGSDVHIAVPSDAPIAEALSVEVSPADPT